MAVTVSPLFQFVPSDFYDLRGLYEPWQAAPAPAPSLVVLNDALAAELGVDVHALRRPEGIAVLSGSVAPGNATPVAQAYAGHQFGGFSPRLGDGRALLLGEVVDIHGRRRDLHMKGSGPTPFARGGDGKAAIGPMLREYLMGEAMHALGIPTTRGLAVVRTGERVHREGAPPGAVLTRVAASHLRVGTFQFAARHEDPTLLRRLADHAIARHYPDVAGDDEPYLTFYARVVEAQASLVARWMLVGFIHGVMNTDNMTISGETIDYGPCAFMDIYDPDTVFSSIDYGGRYAYGNQPSIAQWNLARLGETLLPLLADEPDAAVEKATTVLGSFPERFSGHWRDGMGAKLGLARVEPADVDLANDFLALAQNQRVDFTSGFRALSALALGDAAEHAAARALFSDGDGLDAWLARWHERLSRHGRSGSDVGRTMQAVNPVFIPRNHLVEEALAAATDGDLEPFRQLLDVLARPYDERDGLDLYAAPAPESFGPYRTFCGT